MWIKKFPALLLLGFYSQLVFATNEKNQVTDDLEQLMQTEVISASKLAQQVSDAPSAVAIVTAEDIKTFGYKTIADVINSMKGLYITYDRNYQYMGGRGFGKTVDLAGRVMIMIDGYPTQENIFGQAYIDQSGLIDLELVERIEYVPGTGSVSYGNNALLGMINIVTKKGIDFDATQASTEFGSFGSKKNRVTFGKQLENGLDILLSASLFESDGKKNIKFPELKQNGFPSTSFSNDGQRAEHLFGKATYQGLTLEGAYSKRTKNVPTAPNEFVRVNDDYQTYDENYYLSGKYETDLNLNLKSLTKFYSGHYANQDYIQFVPVLPNDSDQRQYRKNNSEGLWFGIDQKFISSHFDDHTLIYGFEYRKDQIANLVRNYFDPDKKIIAHAKIAYQQPRETYSFYFEDKYNLTKSLDIVYGLRRDTTSDDFQSNSPRLALIYAASEQTTLKGSYSRSFRFPNVYDGWWADGAYKTKPEYVTSQEFLIQHQLDHNTRITATVYHYDLKLTEHTNLLTNDFIVNAASSSNGGEIEFERTWDSGYRLKSSFSYQNAKDSFERRATNSPSTLAKINFSSRPLFGIRTGLEIQYLGPRLTDYYREKLPGIALTNLNFSTEKKSNKGFYTSFSIKNLFDKKYYASTLVNSFDNGTERIYRDKLAMDGRTFWLQLGYDF